MVKKLEPEIDLECLSFARQKAELGVVDDCPVASEQCLTSKGNRCQFGAPKTRTTETRSPNGEAGPQHFVQLKFQLVRNIRSGHNLGNFPPCHSTMTVDSLWQHSMLAKLFHRRLPAEHNSHWSHSNSPKTLMREAPASTGTGISK